MTDSLSLLRLERGRPLLPWTCRNRRAVLKDVGTGFTVNQLIPVHLPHSTPTPYGQFLLLFELTFQMSLLQGNPSLTSTSSRLAQNTPYSWFLIANPCAVLSQQLTLFGFISLVDFLKNMSHPLNCKLQKSKGCTFDSPL